jgi:Interferon-related developmental regulator (IFRD).
MREDDSDYEEDTEEDFQKIQDLLNARLLQVESEKDNNQDKSLGDAKQAAAVALNKSRIQSESTTVNEIIHSLTQPRTEVSTLSRELLLAQLYKLIVSKPLVVYNEENQGSANFVDEEKVQKLLDIFTSGTYRTETEFLYLYRSVISIILSNIEDFSIFVTSEFLSHLQALVVDPASGTISNQNKAHIISGFVSLTLILCNGSSSFGIDDRVLWLMEIAEGYSVSAVELKKKVESGERDHSTLFDKNEDKRLVAEAYDTVSAEISVATAALHGMACLLTLIPRGDFLNEIVENLMFKLVPIVDNDENREISKAAGRVVALIYESYTYGEDDDEEDHEYNSNSPYYEQEQIFSIFERLTNLSSKRVAKKDKKEFNSVFRTILQTLEVYVDSEKRESIYKKSPAGVELITTIMDSTYIRLSKYKSLPINSWYLYARLRNLKWCFSFGLHSQLVANETIRDCLVEPESEYGDSNEFKIDEGLLSEEQAYVEYVNDMMDYKHIVDDKKRSAKIRKERAAKLAETLQDLEITEK